MVRTKIKSPDTIAGGSGRAGRFESEGAEHPTGSLEANPFEAACEEPRMDTNEAGSFDRTEAPRLFKFRRQDDRWNADWRLPNTSLLSRAS